jgi:hypothetical protein
MYVIYVCNGMRANVCVCVCVFQTKMQLPRALPLANPDGRAPTMSSVKYRVKFNCESRVQGGLSVKRGDIVVEEVNPIVLLCVRDFECVRADESLRRCSRCSSLPTTFNRSIHCCGNEQSIVDCCESAHRCVRRAASILPCCYFAILVCPARHCRPVFHGLCRVERRRAHCDIVSSNSDGCGKTSCASSAWRCGAQLLGSLADLECGGARALWCRACVRLAWRRRQSDECARRLPTLSCRVS